jgi:hypothetical protein
MFDPDRFCFPVATMINFKTKPFSVMQPITAAEIQRCNNNEILQQLHLTKQTTKTPTTSTSQNQDISKKQSGQLQKVEDAYAAATIGPETSVAAIRTKQKNFHPPPLQFP